MNYKYLLIVLLGFCISVNTNAQTKPKETKVTPFTPPKMSTMLGLYKDSVVLPRQEILDNIVKPLRVIDQKGVVYSIITYQVAYKQRTVSETDDGRAIPATHLSYEKFYKTPLPEKWTDFLKEELKKGEELYFFDIIAKDPKGRSMYAPALKIIVL